MPWRVRIGFARTWGALTHMLLGLLPDRAHQSDELFHTVSSQVQLHTATVLGVFANRLRQSPAEMATLRLLVRNLCKDLSAPLLYEAEMSAHPPSAWPNVALFAAFNEWGSQLKAMGAALADLQHLVAYPLRKEAYDSKRDAMLLQHFATEQEVLLRMVDQLQGRANAIYRASPLPETVKPRRPRQGSGPALPRTRDAWRWLTLEIHRLRLFMPYAHATRIAATGLGVLGLAVLAVHLLALAALHDLALAAKVLPGSLRTASEMHRLTGTMRAEVRGSNIVVNRDERGATLIRGQMAPVERVILLSDNRIVTLDARGSVVLTRLEATQSGPTLFAGVYGAADRWLWTPIGRTFARNALDLALRFEALTLPIELRARVRARYTDGTEMLWIGSGFAVAPADATRPRRLLHTEDGFLISAEALPAGQGAYPGGPPTATRDEVMIAVQAATDAGEPFDQGTGAHLRDGPLN